MRSFNSWIFPQIELMNCFCRMVDRQKVFSLISNWDHCQFLTIAYFRHAASRIQTCFDLSCTEVITTTPRILELHVSIDKCLLFYQMWLLFLFNHGQNICRLFLALARFPFATSESNYVIVTKRCMYELSLVLPNNLRLRVLGNQEISIKSLKRLELMASPNRLPNSQISTVVIENWETSVVTNSREIPILLNYLHLPTIF